MTIELAGMGCALPVGSLTQDDAANAANRLRCFEDETAGHRQLQLLSALYRRSGVSTRHSVLLTAGDEQAVDRQTFYEVAQDREDRGPSTSLRMQRFESEAPELAERASRMALDASSTAPGEITHLVTVSCSGFNSPGFDLALFPRLGLHAQTARTHVGFMGCHGALNGLRVARAVAASQPSAKVLLCAVELCTLHHQYTDDPQQIVANSLFADGAAAVVVRSAKTAGAARNGQRHWQMVDSGSCLVPDSELAMSWRIGDHGFCMTLSAQVPELIKSQLEPWLRGWLGGHGLKLSDIANWAVHPGGPRILTATAESLSLPPAALAISRKVLSECGNMSSPTILFILQQLAESAVSGPCVALAFGPGLVAEAALLHLD